MNKRNKCQAHLCGLLNPDMPQQNVGTASYSRGSDGSCKPCIILQGGYLLFAVKVAITHSDYHRDVSFHSNAGMQVPLCHLEWHPALLLPPNSIFDCAAVSLWLFSVSTPCHRKAV